MHTPFENPVPKQYTLRIQDYARDLAWGVDYGLWDSKMYANYVGIRGLVCPSGIGLGTIFYGYRDMNDDGRVNNNITFSLSENGARFEQKDMVVELNPDQLAFVDKWFFKESSIENIVAGDYIDFRHFSFDFIPTEEEMLEWGFIKDQDKSYLIAQETFKLLEKPVKAPNIFVSYRRATSSALALAIEARLRLMRHEDVFIDKDIQAGEDWLQVLLNRIDACDYFVLLVDDGVFSESPYTEKEFDYALEQGKTIIPIVHPEVNISQLPSKLTDIQLIDCRGKASASSYEDAINRLLSRLGYATY